MFEDTYKLARQIGLTVDELYQRIAKEPDQEGRAELCCLYRITGTDEGGIHEPSMALLQNCVGTGVYGQWVANQVNPPPEKPKVRKSRRKPQPRLRYVMPSLFD
jgi:hypothetical protein